MKVLAGAAIIFIVIFFSAVSHAVPASCTISSSPGVNFGNYDVYPTTPTDSTGSITITCDKQTWTIVSIGTSANSGSFDPRKMRLTTGTDLLNYNLFTDAARSTIWGDGTGSTQTVTYHAPADTPFTLTIYGRIPAEQDVSVGLYTDSLTALVTP